MSHGPFTEKIAALAPEKWANYLRVVERNKHEGKLSRELEQYGKPIAFESIEEVREEAQAA